MRPVKDEDRQAPHFREVDPVKILERLGIDHYAIDYKERRVVLVHRDNLRRVADDLGKTLLPEAVGFCAAGWWWELGRQEA